MRFYSVRQLTALLLALVCLFSLLSAAEGETYPCTGVTTASLRLRQEPSSSGRILLVIPAGGSVTITGEQGDYYIAAYNGTIGFAMKSYIVVSAPAPVQTADAARTPAPAYAPLSSGSSGEAVKKLQTALKNLGYYASSIDGKFGGGTKSAVSAFQQMNGLSPTGVADSATQQLLFDGAPKNSRGVSAATAVPVTPPPTAAPVYAVLSNGSKGAAVSQLQARLKELGYYASAVDGIYGSGTAGCVRSFQARNGLAQTGVADSATQAALYSASASPAFAPAPTPTLIPTNPPAQPIASYPFLTYTLAAVNMRKGASTSSARILTIPKGAEITALSMSGEFLQVSYNGGIGYILAQYAQVPSQYLPGTSLDENSEAQQHYPPLQSGSTGKIVSLLQEALKELGFYSCPLDGIYGATTVAAVNAFQKKNSLRQDGTASPELQQLIFEGAPLNSRGRKTNVSVLPPYDGVEMKLGDKGDQVSDLKSRLKSLGLYSGAISRVFDNATQSAVKKFQSGHSLTVDGVVGPKTWTLLTALTNHTPTPAPAGGAAAPTPAATPITSQNVIIMRNGTRGAVVTHLQNRLMELGYYTCKADGIYDADEIRAVQEFQRKNGLKIDGVAGLETQQLLFSDRALPATSVALPTASPVPAAPFATLEPVWPTAVPASFFNPTQETLKIGSAGDGVRALQTRLKQLGFYIGAVDGDYGSGTALAVTRFQKAYGISSDGVAGPKTLSMLYALPVPTATPRPTATPAPARVTATPRAAAIATAAPLPSSASTISVSTEKALQSGDEGSDVRLMQQRLVQLGYLNRADGVFGSKTYSAVVNFQRRNGLTADGIAGKMTLNRLYSTSAVAAQGTAISAAAAIAASAAAAAASANPSAGFTPPSASQVRYANWFNEIRAIARSMPDVVIYDPVSGLHFNLHMFSFGKHADSETPTAADTAILNQVVGVNTWTPKYVWVVFPDGKVYIASIHSHGHEVDHTPNNDLEGHICLHFPRIMSEAEQTGPYAVSHQKEINWGWEMTQTMID